MNSSTELNQSAVSLLQMANFETLEINQQSVFGGNMLDFAIGREGTVAAGQLLAEVCFGGKAEVSVSESEHELGLRTVSVKTSDPLTACIGGQYAGWPLATDDYFAMCSGPIRMVRGKEEILTEYDLVGESEMAVGVLESNKLPSKDAIDSLASETNLSPNQITLCVARTASLPGLIQVVARSVETTLHKLHEIDFDLKTIVGGRGSAPVPPTPDDDMVALGWTNDSILYGASVQLNVDTIDQAIEAMINRLPSCSSSEFGTPFLDIFKKYDHDFYKIDKMLFSPAHVTITNDASGKTFEVGSVRNDILRASFGL